MGPQTQILAFKSATLKGRASPSMLIHDVYHMTDSTSDRASLSTDNDHIFTRVTRDLTAFAARSPPLARIYICAISTQPPGLNLPHWVTNS